MGAPKEILSFVAFDEFKGVGKLEGLTVDQKHISVTFDSNPHLSLEVRLAPKSWPNWKRMEKSFYYWDKAKY